MHLATHGGLKRRGMGRQLQADGVLARSTRDTAKLPTLLLLALRAGQVQGLGWRFGPRCETTECHIYNYNVFVFCNYNVLFSLKSILVLLFRTSSCLERRAHCWFAAERAASLADAARHAAFGPTPCRCRDQQATAVLPLLRCYNPPSRRRAVNVIRRA